jgi:uncharacterized protein (DUF2384 family)
MSGNPSYPFGIFYEDPEQKDLRERVWRMSWAIKIHMYRDDGRMPKEVHDRVVQMIYSNDEELHKLVETIVKSYDRRRNG